jgi:ABC-type multidrug transport system fused ATPase/permease subunit
MLYSCFANGSTRKSSLTAAVFRLLEIESGSIFLDGVDLCNFELSDVRGRANGMAIIP